MAEWILVEDGKVCRPCVIVPAIQWYEEELNEQGKPGLAREIDKACEKAIPEEVAKKMDEVKSQVDSSLRTRLEEFDCAVQNYNPDEELLA